MSRDDRARPNDADDLASLRVVATDADWDEATIAVDLIVERGYHRDRDLASEVQVLRANGAYGHTPGE